MSHHYLLHGLHVASQLPLPELLPDAADHGTQVHIRSQAVSPQLQGEVRSDGRWRCNGVELLLSVPDIGRFLIRGGTDIYVAAESAADAAAVRMILLGSAWAACCQQRGLLMLHASAVVIGGTCIAFLGNSGAGKSTLAALLARRGHTLAADDACALTHSGTQTWLHPAAPRLKLWQETVPLLVNTARDIQPAAARRPGKFQLSLPQQWLYQPVPLTHLLVLEDDRSGATAGFEPLSVLDRVRAIAAHTFRPQLPRLLGRQRQFFAACAELAANTTMHRWIRPWGLAHQDTALDALEQWLCQPVKSGAQQRSGAADSITTVDAR